MTSPHSPANSPSRPFAAAPDASRYFPASAMEEARQRIGRSMLRGEGPVLLIGASGLGKSMLLEVVAQQFRDQLQSVTLVGGQLCTRRALLQMILFQLGLPYREMDESELRLSLLSYLQPQEAAPQRILLLVDEADALPPRLLEELRALTNLSIAGQLQVNLVLAGNSTLEEQFADPKLDLFSQRIAARCYLSAFGREETFHFVHAQIAATGQDPQTLFTDDGLEALFAATDGVPRLINQLGDQLLWMVAETGYSPLDGLIVQQAWSELQQLPAPWNTQTGEPHSSEVEYGEVEYGDLDSNGVDRANNLGEIEEIVFEDDANDEGYTVDFDDDLPTSIPFQAPQTDDTQITEKESVLEISSEMTSTESLDITEDLLKQLQVMDNSQETIAPATTDNAPAKNPFNETFDSEEVVLDRYSAFESLLLAEAPRVVNLADTSFAQQLQQFETFETPVSTLQPKENDAFAGLEELSISTDDPATQVLATSDTAVEPGEILVIEESEQSQPAVVGGQKLRQLFSSLEKANGEPCFG